MLKIKIELIKYENANATTRPIIYQNFRNLRKNKKWNSHFVFCFAFIFEILFFEEALYESSVWKLG